MPNIKSAIKRVSVAEKKTKRNNMIKSAYKSAVKKYEIANANGDKEAIELLSEAKSKIDSACTKGVISKNAASRKKSRLEKKLAVKVDTKKVAAKKTEKKESVEEKAEVEAPKKEAKKTTTKKTTKKAE
jgi:small subunit ribosomal protein S20